MGRYSCTKYLNKDRLESRQFFNENSAIPLFYPQIVCHGCQINVSLFMFSGLKHFFRNYLWLSPNMNAIFGNKRYLSLRNKRPFCHVNILTIVCQIQILVEYLSIHMNIKNPPAKRARGSIILEIKCNVVVSIGEGIRWPFQRKSLASTGC